MRWIFGAAAMLLVSAISPATAQEWPARTVTIIVPFSAGGTADLFARLLATHMQQKLGGSFIVENRAGRGRQYRRRRGREGDARRLHAAAWHGVHACDQPIHVFEYAIRSGQGLSSRSA